MRAGRSFLFSNIAERESGSDHHAIRSYHCNGCGQYDPLCSNGLHLLLSATRRLHVRFVFGPEPGRSPAPTNRPPQETFPAREYSRAPRGACVDTPAVKPAFAK